MILLGHGAFSEELNNHWLENLKALAAYVRKHSGLPFRAIRYATWREDWPEKRKRAVESVRSMVVEASREGGVALLIPVRPAGQQGPGRKFLQGLEFRYANGFAPHPGFTEWLKGTIEEGIRYLTRRAGSVCRASGSLGEKYGKDG